MLFLHTKPSKINFLTSENFGQEQPHDINKLRLILSPHTFNRQTQDIDTMHTPPSDHDIHLVNICASNIGS